MGTLVPLIFLVCLASVGAQLACPPGNDCSGMCNAIDAAGITTSYGNLSTLVLPCPVGFLCLQDTLPYRCPRRYYCPDAITQIKCPSGHFCIKGSSIPKKCPPGAVCPEGSWKYIHVTAIFVIFLTHAVIAAVYFAISRGSNRLRMDVELTDVGMSNEASSPPLNFWFQDLQVKIKLGNFISKLWGPEKLLLQSVSGKFEAGRLAAVMGPSGAGKSTFVNVLLGKVQKSSGTILVNGVEASKINLRSCIGFVPQEDIMLRQGVTVRDILLHSAKTRLPSSWSKEEIEGKVDDTIKLLKLDIVQNNVVGDEITRGLSGGERKRVNIGIELVADPIALVCDEPTSGLDTTSAYDVMYFLHQIAKETSMTIIVVLHQPRHEIFELVDDLLLLGKGGHTMYIGPVANVNDYFATLGYPCPSHVNPADHYIDVVSGKVDMPNVGASTVMDHLIDSWQRNKANFTMEKQEPSEVPKETRAPLIKQFLAYTKRAFLQLFRDVTGRLVDNFLHFLAGAIIALGFVSGETFIPPIPRRYLPLCPPSVALPFCGYPEAATVARIPVYATIAVGLAAATIGVRTFFNERTVYWRETASGTNTLVYFLAKNFVDLFPIFLYALTFTCAFITVSGPSGSFSIYLCTILLYEYCLYAVGYICGWLSDANPAVMAVIVALLSGLGTQATGVPFMWSRWASQAIITNELDYYGQPDEIKPLVDDYIVVVWKYKNYRDAIGTCMIALLLIGAGLRALAYLLMRLTRRDMQK